MSYILDALRRAERERHLGQAPTLETLTHAGPTATTAGLPRWAAVALVVLMALLLAASLWMLWPRKPAQVAAPPPAPVVAEPRVAAPLPATVAAAEAASVIDDGEMVESLDDVAAPFTVGRAGSGTPAEPGVTTVTPSVAAPVTATPEVRTQPAAPSTPPTPASQLPRALRDMPVEYRRQFPAVTLDVHVYNSDPARRWIMVDGRRYAEGQTLDGGQRIGAIVPEGAILEFAGERVLLPLIR